MVVEIYQAGSRTRTVLLSMSRWTMGESSTR
jgi:hypothetical protein